MSDKFAYKRFYKQGREVMFDLISWRIHEFYKSHVSAAVTVRPVKEIKGDPQVNHLTVS